MTTPNLESSLSERGSMRAEEGREPLLEFGIISQTETGALQVRKVRGAFLKEGVDGVIGLLQSLPDPAARYPRVRRILLLEWSSEGALSRQSVVVSTRFEHPIEARLAEGLLGNGYPNGLLPHQEPFLAMALAEPDIARKRWFGWRRKRRRGPGPARFPALFPLIQFRIDPRGSRRDPRDPLGRAFHLCRMRNRSALRDLGDLVAHLGQHGIETLVVGDLPLIRQAYPDVGTRENHRTWILVREECHSRARVLFQESRDPGQRSGRGGPITVRRAAGSTLQLENRLPMGTGDPALESRILSDWWEHSQDQIMTENSVGQARVRVLHPTDELLRILLQGLLRPDPANPWWILDVIMMLDRLEPRIDGSRFWHTIDGVGHRDWFIRALDHARRLAGSGKTPVPGVAGSRGSELSPRPGRSPCGRSP